MRIFILLLKNDFSLCFLPTIFKKIGLLFYLIIETGTIEGVEQTIMDKIEHSDSYSALLWGTMGTSLLTILFYLLQWHKEDQNYSLPSCQYFYSMLCTKKEANPPEPLVAKTPNKVGQNNSDESPNLHDDIVAFYVGSLENNENDNQETIARPLISLPIAVESFLGGMTTFFPALVVLILALATGYLTIDIGADRLFARWIMNNIQPELLPTITFLISFVTTLSVTSAWGTISILYPLVLVPTYISSQGNATIFYAVVASVLNGAVAGNHMCPISDTTIISALAADCAIMRHVVTRTPYCIVVIIAAVLVGTLPIGYQIWPSYVSAILGFLVMTFFVFFGCVPISDPSGKYDAMTELYLTWIKNDSNLMELRKDTMNWFALQQIDLQKTPSILAEKDDALQETAQADSWSEDWNNEDDYDL
jgi:Na+/H+ antiporter family